MRRALIFSAVALVSIAFANSGFAQPTTEPSTQPAADAKPAAAPDVVADRPLVQIALLLDTSNSMDGLINQARTQLWTIVNEISRSKRNGQMPRVQVALFEYGNDSLAKGEGFIRMVLPLSDDLDSISEKLFTLTTNGGSEFCGQVIQQATSTLNWSSDPNVYKAIFIAGNEPFGQGTVDYHSTCPAAISRGIVVNTIHCGERQDGLEGGWAEGAKLGEGYFSNIDQNRIRAVPRCPQDDRIETLSVKINVTYVPYGTAGKDSAKRQAMQDQNATAEPAAGASVQRAASKAGMNYQNGTWDLVDAVLNDKLDLAKVAEKDLPENMRSMTIDERKAYVTKQAKDRDALRAEINKLVSEREQFLVDHDKQEAGSATLDSAIITSVRDQLKARKYDVAK